MSFFKKLFSGKADRISQIAASAELQRQQEEASQRQALLQQQLTEASNSSQEQLRLLAEQNSASLAAAAETARLSQTQSDEANYRASLTPGDSEDARAEADRRQRRLQRQRGFSSTIVSRSDSPLGAAPIASQRLLGV